jgi:hypothetical protein
MTTEQETQPATIVPGWVLRGLDGRTHTTLLRDDTDCFVFAQRLQSADGETETTNTTTTTSDS